MESHALHGDGLYFESDDSIWVNLFVPSTAQFTLGDVALRMETSFPDGDAATITLTMPRAKEFTLAVRRPSWAGDGFVVKVNGTPVPQPLLASLRAGSAGGRAVGTENASLEPSTYVDLKRTWKSGDMIELTLPKSVRLEPPPDDKQDPATSSRRMSRACQRRRRHQLMLCSRHFIGRIVAPTACTSTW
ncbi:MAG: hypothetical protein ABJE10_06195 [bacterium]